MRKSEPDSIYFGENLEHLSLPLQNQQKPPKNHVKYVRAFIIGTPIVMHRSLGRATAVQFTAAKSLCLKSCKNKTTGS